MFFVLVANVFGFIASIGAFVLWFPQAARTWSVRNDPEAMAGISSGTQWLVAFNAVMWSFYAVLGQAWWSGVPAVVNFPLACATLFLIYRARRIHGGRPVKSPARALPQLETASAP